MSEDIAVRPSDMIAGKYLVEDVLGKGQMGVIVKVAGRRRTGAPRALLARSARRGGGGSEPDDERYAGNMMD